MGRQSALCAGANQNGLSSSRSARGTSAAAHKTVICECREMVPFSQRSDSLQIIFDYKIPFFVVVVAHGPCFHRSAWLLAAFTWAPAIAMGCLLRVPIKKNTRAAHELDWFFLARPHKQQVAWHANETAVKQKVFSKIVDLLHQLLHVHVVVVAYTIYHLSGLPFTIDM